MYEQAPKAVNNVNSDRDIPNSQFCTGFGAASRGIATRTLGEGFMYVHLCFGIQKFER
jgi:hypothetical protein